MKRIYIPGAIGRGKTRAARPLSQASNRPCHGLDQIAFDLESKP